MRRSTLQRRAVLIAALAFIAFTCYEWSTLVPKANAIPAFARKYNYACNVCHVPGFPKLNDFGNQFRDHGYQLGSDNDLPDFVGVTSSAQSMGSAPAAGQVEPSTKSEGPASTASSLEERLDRLKRLRDSGRITEEEYREKRKQLLGQL
jgi:hypothetical protein